MLKGTLSYHPVSNKLNTVKMLHVPSHNCIMHSPVYCLLGPAPFLLFVITIFVCFISLCILPLFGSIISATISLHRASILIKHKPRELMILKLPTRKLHDRISQIKTHPSSLKKLWSYFSKENYQPHWQWLWLFLWKKLLRNQLKKWHTSTEKNNNPFLLALCAFVYCLFCFYLLLKIPFPRKWKLHAYLTVSLKTSSLASCLGYERTSRSSFFSTLNCI